MLGSNIKRERCEVSSEEFGMAHYNKKRNNRNLGKRGGQGKGKSPAKAPALELCFIFWSLFSLASLWILLFLLPSFSGGLGGVSCRPDLSQRLRTSMDTPQPLNYKKYKTYDHEDHHEKLTHWVTTPFHISFWSCADTNIDPKISARKQSTPVARYGVLRPPYLRGQYGAKSALMPNIFMAIDRCTKIKDAGFSRSL